MGPAGRLLVTTALGMTLGVVVAWLLLGLGMPWPGIASPNRAMAALGYVALGGLCTTAGVTVAVVVLAPWWIGRS